MKVSQWTTIGTALFGLQLSLLSSQVIGAADGNMETGSEIRTRAGPEEAFRIVLKVLTGPLHRLGNLIDTGRPD